MKAKLVLTSLLFSGLAHADARDDEIFGSESAPLAPPAAATPSPGAASPLSFDALALGGRLELGATATKQKNVSTATSPIYRNTRADLYLDARHSERLRSFVRARFSEGNLAPGLTTELDEAWLRFTLRESWFFTAGKQHLKWGAGRFWNPTDFLAPEARDPFSQFDARLGTTLLKVHYPIEKYGFNYYLVADVNNVSTVGDSTLAVRAEHVFGTAESALTAAAQSGGPSRFGVDLSVGLGPLDFVAEGALHRNHKQKFFRGTLDPSTLELPEQYSREDERLYQAVGGVSSTIKYSDDDSVTLATEYFWNGMGYDSRTLEMYSLLNGEGRPLYLGRHYVAALMRLPTPGSWNSTSFGLTGVRNLSDTSSRAQLFSTYELFTRVSVELSFSQCFGKIGDLCPALPDEYRTLAQDPRVPEAARAALTRVPANVTTSSLGLRLVSEF